MVTTDLTGTQFWWLAETRGSNKKYYRDIGPACEGTVDLLWEDEPLLAQLTPASVQG